MRLEINENEKVLLIMSLALYSNNVANRIMKAQISNLIDKITGVTPC